MLFQFADYVLDIDVERTRAFYERPDVPTISAQCDCDYCQNYDKAIGKASASVRDLLHSLGINPRKPAEVYSVTGELEEQGTVWYNGWYHVCGTIVDSPETVQVTKGADGSSSAVYRWELAYTPDPAFPFAILPTQDSFMMHEDFPKPVIQVEIDTHLPYVLSSSSGD